MGDIAKFIIEFFTNKGLHIGYRLSLLIIFVIGIMFVNDILGLTRNYVLNSELEQIIRLKQIDPNILLDDSLVNKKYVQVKADIIADKSKSAEIIGYFKGIFSNFQQSTSQGYIIIRDTLKVPILHLQHNNSPSIVKPPPQSPNKEVSKGQRSDKSKFDYLDLSTMTYFYLIILSFLIGIIFVLYSKKETVKSKITTTVSIFVAMIGVFFIGRLYTLLVSLIPLIYRYEWINYTGYFLFPVSITIFLFYKNPKKTTENIP